MIAEASTDMAPRGAVDPVSALTALLAPAGTSPRPAGSRYELRLHRARGYGALKAILDVLAEEEPLTLTEIALRLRRTPGLDQGLPVVARGRRSDRVAAETIQLHRSDDAAVGPAALPRGPTDRGRHRAAKSTPTC